MEKKKIYLNNKADEVELDSLTERERKIYDAGYYEGHQKGGGTMFLIFMGALLFGGIVFFITTQIVKQ